MERHREKISDQSGGGWILSSTMIINFMCIYTYRYMYVFSPYILMIKRKRRRSKERLSRQLNSRSVSIIIEKKQDLCFNMNLPPSVYYKYHQPNFLTYRQTLIINRSYLIELSRQSSFF
jgi:hypothetical protein